ncbi:MAG: heavy metal translocating P-type ATPase [Gammaproteobacteria bacterium]|nr:heavy metal translocating P-type ATPase [Gammaproteobacteria bacterium]
MVNAQHQDLLKRMGVAGVFGMQIMVIAVALYSSAWTSIQSEYEELFRRLSLLFVLPVLFYSAAPILAGAWRDLKQRTATMDVPIALGLIIAFFASLTATLSGSGEIYYDSIAMFVFIQLIARFLEKGAYRRMTDRITSLSASTPNHANRLVDPDQVHSAVVVPALRLVAGDFVLIKPGEAIPADGEIVSGSTDVDEALLTGESNVVHRTIGDAVFGGSINVSSAVVVRVVRPSADSALASIVKLLEDSMSGKPSSTRLTDQIAGYFSATVVMIALCVGVFWYWSGDTNWLSYPIAVLVVACPCALALAVPTALTAAVNSAAKRNILIARPDAVQALAKVNTFLFDKTGTLTQSQARLIRTDIFGQLSRSEAHDVAALLSAFSDHPICRALASSLESEGTEVVEVDIEHGGGIAGCVNEKRYYLGSRSYIASKLPGAIDKISEPSDQVGLIAYLSDDTGVLAKFHFDNPLRGDALRLIGRIKELPAKLALVTGDRQSEAERVARELNIAEVHWGCSPKGKLNIIRSHQNLGECVAMVGDGINDTPTLAIANVSVAPARAQQIAKANADVLLLDDRLELLATARNLAEFSVKVMRNNTVWAIAYNLIGISLAAAGFVPPLAAAIGMSVSSILVVGNSLRITAYEYVNT